MCDESGISTKKRKPKIKKKFSHLVANAAGAAVSRQGYVSVIDLFLGIGWLTRDKVSDWKAGRIPYLERVITANLNKISRTMKEFRQWANHSKLKASVTVYKHKNMKLRFSKYREQNIEMAYSTHYVLLKNERNKEPLIERQP